jgi:exosortase
MPHSIFPVLNYLVWLGVRGRAEVLEGDNVGSIKSRRDSPAVFGDAEQAKYFVWEVSHAVTLAVGLSLPILVAVLYAPVIGSMVRQWWSDPNYGHGFFVPAFAGYVLWSAHGRWRSLPLRPSNSGLVLMLIAIALRILGMLGAELFMARLSLVVLIAGITLFLAGRQALWSVAFPIGYLLFMIPLPAILYYQLTLPLQLWASRLGATGLVALGIRTVREGNLLFLPNCTLNVVEACSGIRSLLSLLAATVAYGYLAEQSTQKRIFLAITSIPIAIAANGLRLVATGVLSYYFGPGVDSGSVHMMLGLGFFVLAFLSVLLVHKLLGLHVRAHNSLRASL